MPLIPVAIAALVGGTGGFALSSFANGLVNKLIALGVLAAGIYYVFMRGA